MKWKAFVALAIVVAGLFGGFSVGTVEAQAVTITETLITYTINTADQERPAIYGDRIVYEDDRNGNWDIYMYDLSTSTETQITTNTARQEDPAIYGDRIVWEDDRNGPYDIYMYDLPTTTETQITTNTAFQERPAIYGDRIVWMDYRNGPGNWDIYMYDLPTTTETQITTNTAHQKFPAIFGNRIVWHDLRNGNWDIYLGEIFSVPPNGQVNAIIGVLAGIPIDDFAGSVGDVVKENRRNALLNRLQAVIMDIQTAEASSDPSTINTALQSAIDQLNSILDKMDGFAERGTADTKGSGNTPDWIVTSASQALVDPLIRHLIATLEALLIP